jgi:hypothetical protein
MSRNRWLTRLAIAPRAKMLKAEQQHTLIIRSCWMKFASHRNI